MSLYNSLSMLVSWDFFVVFSFNFSWALRKKRLDKEENDDDNKKGSTKISKSKRISSNARVSHTKWHATNDKMRTEKLAHKRILKIRFTNDVRSFSCWFAPPWRGRAKTNEKFLLHAIRISFTLRLSSFSPSCWLMRVRGKYTISLFFAHALWICMMDHLRWLIFLHSKCLRLSLHSEAKKNEENSSQNVTKRCKQKERKRKAVVIVCRFSHSLLFPIFNSHSTVDFVLFAISFTLTNIYTLISRVKIDDEGWKCLRFFFTFRNLSIKLCACATTTHMRWSHVDSVWKYLLIRRHLNTIISVSRRTHGPIPANSTWERQRQCQRTRNDSKECRAEAATDSESSKKDVDDNAMH